MRHREGARLAALVKQSLALAQQYRERERADLVDEVRGEQRMYKFGAALCDERRAVFLFQFRDVLRRVAQRHGAFPREVSAFARRHIFRDPVERSGDVVVRAAFGIGPICREDVVGTPAQQKVERLTEQVATLTKERDSAAAKADRLEIAIEKSTAMQDAIEACPNCAVLSYDDTPPAPGTALKVRSLTSYLCTEATWMACLSETML